MVVLHIGVAGHQCVRPHPREEYNCYITCYLGNRVLSRQQRDMSNILICCLGNGLYSTQTKNAIEQRCIITLQNDEGGDVVCPVTSLFSFYKL